MRVHIARWDDLEIHELYGFLQLRAEVLAVEHDLVFNDIDGRDLEPTTSHYWIVDSERTQYTIVAYLRTTHESDDPILDSPIRVSRVSILKEYRGRGLMARLVDAAIQRSGRPIVTDAYAPAVGFYSKLGFRPHGEVFYKNGLEFVRMVID